VKRKHFYISNMVAFSND